LIGAFLKLQEKIRTESVIEPSLLNKWSSKRAAELATAKV